MFFVGPRVPPLLCRCASEQGVGCRLPVAGARAMGAAGRGRGSSYAGSAGRHSCVRVGTRCSPPRGPWRPRCERRLRPGALLPPAALLLGAVGARCPGAVGTGVRVRGPALSPWPVFPVFLRGGQPGFRGPRVRYEGRHRSVAPPPPTVRPLGGLSGSVIHSCCGRGCAGVAARRCPLGLHALWGPRSAGVVGAFPGGVACHRCEGRLVSGAVLPPGRSPSERAVRVRHPHAVCAGVRARGPGTVFSACMPCGSCVPRGWWGAAPGGGGLPPL